MQSEHISTYSIDDVDVEVYGYYDENTTEGDYDYYDLFVGSDCINEGNPLYTLASIQQDIRWCLKRS